MPLMVGPTGIADLLSYRGELALAKAATKAGIPFALSSSSTTPMERVFEATNGGMWLQLYLWENRELSYEIIARARSLGVGTLIFTVDTAVLPNREFNLRNGFVNPFRVTPRVSLDLAAHPRWLFGVMGRYMLEGGVPRYANYPQQVSGAITGRPQRINHAASANWDDVKAMRAFWPGKLMIKGILSPDDAVLAKSHGADGIFVSNHGGRNLDSSVAPINILSAIKAAVGHDLTVIFDGGVRRGSDIVKAMALGADGVSIGKAALYGLAAGGQAGVTQALEMLRREVDITMALVGRKSISELDSTLIAQQVG
jgi:(S)-mandelate dehydrogenase